MQSLIFKASKRSVQSLILSFLRSAKEQFPLVVFLSFGEASYVVHNTQKEV